jgi:hypothetical protein
MIEVDCSPPPPPLAPGGGIQKSSSDPHPDATFPDHEPRRGVLRISRVEADVNK